MVFLMISILFLEKANNTIYDIGKLAYNDVKMIFIALLMQMSENMRAEIFRQLC